jgi:hypothetical protein
MACLGIERLPEMSSFDLAAYVRASTEAQGVPERLTDRDTVLTVVLAITLAKQSVLLSGRTPTLDYPARLVSASGDRPASSA